MKFVTGVTVLALASVLAGCGYYLTTEHMMYGSNATKIPVRGQTPEQVAEDQAQCLLVAVMAATHPEQQILSYSYGDGISLYARTTRDPRVVRTREYQQCMRDRGYVHGAWWKK